jgi:hypothetical protein
MAVADQGDAKSFEFQAVSRGNASGSMALSPNTCRRRLIAMPDLLDAAQIVGTRADRLNQCREIIASDEKRDKGSMLTPDLIAAHFTEAEHRYLGAKLPAPPISNLSLAG